MGKRSDFARVDRDFYKTPPKAVQPLLRHLPGSVQFVEPCAGDGALIDALAAAGHRCVDALDIVPGRQDIREGDALTATAPSWEQADMFITNSPWDRKILHPLIVHLSDILPTWLLFDADWKHTMQAAPYMSRCRAIVSVGRVRWIEGSKSDGKDNCAWYLFDKPSDAPAQFFGRERPTPQLSKLQVVNYICDILGGESQPATFADILG